MIRVLSRRTYEPYFSVLSLAHGDLGDDGVVDRMRARVRCRRISVHQHEVRIKFMNEEDARLFADDLKVFIERE
jgi:hypothetical protein